MMDSPSSASAAGVAGLIRASRSIVVFTGAGVSTESGIPDFRSPGGIWDRFDSAEFTFQRFMASEEVRKKSWSMMKDMMALNAQPNAAHTTIARLHSMDKLDCVITQNIDGLHQEAGVPEEKVIELHGTARWVACFGCGARFPALEIHRRLHAGEDAPYCERCGGILKSCTISFGQPMPVRETLEAERRSRLADLFVVIGSSLVVYPAAHMPAYAVESGAKLVIINLTPTHLDRYAAVLIRERAGVAMTEIMDRL